MFLFQRAAFAGWLATVLCASGAEDIFQWSTLPAIPDREGFAAPFAGVSEGALIVAGGANFPQGYPWEGGSKVWSDSIFVLTAPNAEWKQVGKLPAPRAYGVSLSTDRGVLCLGGGDAEQHFADAFLLEWNGQKTVVRPLPPLPAPCAFMCGAELDGTLYVAGGTEAPDSTRARKTFWSFDLSDSRGHWQRLAPWPGPGRILATAAAQDGSFFLISGASLSAGPGGKPVRSWLKDAYRFTPGKGWKRIADLPRVAVAAPSPAPAPTRSTFAVLGGDDGSKADFEPLSKHPGFPRTIQVFDTETGDWSTRGEVPFSRVTVPVVKWKGRYVLPNGEARPGVRSPEVWWGKATRK